MEITHFSQLQFGGWLSIAVVIICFALVSIFRAPEDFTFLGGLTLLLLTGVLDAKDTLNGFSSSGMVTVGVLYIIVCGLKETGALSWISQYLLGYPKSYKKALLKIFLPVTGLSAFLNNTPVVAMFIPIITEWCDQIQQKPSKLLIPLSYASIFGGVCTLIGTSTNLVVNGLIQQNYNRAGLSMFEITKIGIPCAIIGMLYLYFLGDKLLPAKEAINTIFNDTEKYIIEAEVADSSPIVGKTIKQAGLRNLPGGYIIELLRRGNIITPVLPTEIIQQKDIFVITGNKKSMLNIYQKKGLFPAGNQIFEINSPRHKRKLVEAVISPFSPVINKTVKECNFRKVYNAVVIAVARKGERLSEKIGNIKLAPGDILLIECHNGFAMRQKETHDFYLINQTENVSPTNYNKGPLALFILVAMVILAAFGIISILKASLAAALAMLILKCCTPSQAQKSIEWKVLIVIASTLGLGLALSKSGAATAIAYSLLHFSNNSPWISLLIITLITTCLTEIVTNNGAAAIVFPIALNLSLHLGVNPMPFFMCIMIGASASFATPIGYQTNLMVYGPGGYNFKDYFKIGIPLNIIICITSVLLAPLIWPF